MLCSGSRDNVNTDLQDPGWNDLYGRYAPFFCNALNQPGDAHVGLGIFDFAGAPYTLPREQGKFRQEEDREKSQGHDTNTGSEYRRDGMTVDCHGN